MKTYLANNNIKLFATHCERKAQIVEKSNRTIKGIMSRFFTDKNTRRYIQCILPQGDRVLLYVKWEGYPGKVNGYMFQDEIKS